MEIGLIAAKLPAYALLEEALPPHWIGFLALGLIILVTAIAIGLLLLSDECRL